jgi:hypothetical protein
LNVDGRTFATAEHYMMWRKATLFDDDEPILSAPHPHRAKALGRQVRGFDQETWDQPPHREQPVSPTNSRNEATCGAVQTATDGRGPPCRQASTRWLVHTCGPPQRGQLDEPGRVVASQPVAERGVECPSGGWRGRGEASPGGVGDRIGCS